MSDPWGQFKDAEADPWSQFKDAPKVQRRQAPLPKATLGQDISGAMANLNRGLGVGDEIVGGLSAVGGMMRGESPRNAFNQGMARQRAMEDDFAVRHPRIAATMRGIGMAGTVAAPAGVFAQAGMRGAALTGALQGGAYGALDRGSPSQRANAMNVGIGAGAVIGAGASKVPGVVNALASRAPRPSPQRLLRDKGVFLTPGQRMGGMARQTENVARRAPILGPAIDSAAARSNASMNRSVGIQALEPIGGTIPRGVKPGFEMVRYVDAEIGKHYDRAAALVPVVQPDARIATEIADLGARATNDLSDDAARQLGRILQSRLGRVANSNMSGADLKRVHAELGSLGRKAARSNDLDQQLMGDYIEEARGSLMDLLGRHNPRAEQLVRQADQSWTIYKTMNTAAKAASARGGVFLPGQLNSAATRGAGGMGVNMAGKGQGRLQEFASAAAQVMPDQFGNPGTANALGAGSLGTLAVTGQLDKAIPPVVALTAAATPYMLMGRKVIESLPANASRGQLQAAAQRLVALGQKDPAVAALAREVLSRAGRIGGETAVSATGP